YVLRRIMRRAIQQGLDLELEPGFLGSYAERVRELMGGAYPELSEQWEAIGKWLAFEEEAFGRTLEHGMGNLRDHIAKARAQGRESLRAEDAFQLHDTFGFPFDLTKELLAGEGLTVDERGFEELMEGQRARARAAGGSGEQGQGPRERAREFAGLTASESRFTGYETEVQQTTVGALAEENGHYLVKLAESPFYAAGGGQVADVGTIECENGDCRARVQDVFRLGEDQVLSVVLEQGALQPDERVLARVDRVTRHATECNHTATHLLQAALRARLGAHVRQAGSYVGPDKLRFDFSHGHGLTESELRDVEDQVNAWIARNDPVRAITTTLDEAKRLGAMALFGEKYGEVVRMVHAGEGGGGGGNPYSRELCGGTHVRSTAEIGPFHILSETSSAANVRRIEAVTGPAAVELLREHGRLLQEAAAALQARPEEVPERVRTNERERKKMDKALRQLEGGLIGVDAPALAAGAQAIAGVPVVSAEVEVPEAKALVDLLDRVNGQLTDDGVVVLGSRTGDRVSLVVSVAPALVQRGLRAGELIKAAAAVVGGGGGGRDTLAQAGGRDPEKLGEALEAAKAAIAAALES
ncbi:MAG TPA: alanine--tRNA ligase-related protein, partial [Solirubrobacteraceae bacterium]